MSMDRPEAADNMDKLATQTPEKTIEASDDLKDSYKCQSDSFDDLKASYKSGQPGTFDDLKTSYHGDQIDSSDNTLDKSASERSDKETPEAIEQRKMSQVASDIRKQDQMQPEKWKSLSDEDKGRALKHFGRSLGDAYDTPDPPLFLEKDSPNSQGSFGNGWKYDSTKDEIVGSEYGIKMNKEAITEGNTKLFGDDPKYAVATFGHEFRHSYQTEQAERFNKGFKTDDPVKAKEWSENFKDPKNPPDNELKETNPERYSKEFAEYENQPVERDANGFGRRLASAIFDNKKS